MSDNAKAALAAVFTQRELTRSMQTLHGICAGMLSDGQLTDQEIHFLSTWLAEHPGVAGAWPGSEIHRRVRDVVSDGKITEEERTELLEVLTKLTGSDFAATGSVTSESTTLPIDADPGFIFENRSFCFTGTFVFGTRAACERAVLQLGAMPVDTVTRRLDYLIIGATVSPQWANTSYGRKIEKAVEAKSKGAALVIASERQWTNAVQARQSKEGRQ